MYEKNIKYNCYSFVFTDDELHNNPNIYNDIVEAISLFFIEMDNSIKENDSIYIHGAFVDERKYYESDPKKSFIYVLQFEIGRSIPIVGDDMCVMIYIFDSNDIKSMWRNAWLLVNKLFMNKKLKKYLYGVHVKHRIFLNCNT